MSEDSRTDEEQLQDARDASRGIHARRELELTWAAFEKIKTAALEELVRTSPHQAELRERLYRVANMTESVREALMNIVAAGEVANARMALAEQDLLRP